MDRIIKKTDGVGDKNMYHHVYQSHCLFIICFKFIFHYALLCIAHMPLI